MADCTNQASSTNDFCNEIDEIMKHEHEDAISLDDTLPITSLDLDLDSISDLLENPRSSSSATTASSFTQSLNVNDLSVLYKLFPQIPSIWLFDDDFNKLIGGINFA